MQRERWIGLGALAVCLALLGWWLARERETARSVAPVVADSLPSVEVAPAPLEPSETRAASAPSTPDASSLAPDLVTGDRPRVVVLVVDRRDAPIDGATVEIIGDGPLGTHPTSSDGRCTLPIPVENDSVQLHVSAAGFVPVSLRIGREPEIRFELARALTVHGRVVVAGTGDVVPGALLRVRHYPSLALDEISTTADGAGRFELAGVPELEPRTWLASAHGFATSKRELQLADASSEVVLEVERGVEFTFEVVDMLTQAPLAGAQVAAEFDTLVADSFGRVVTSAVLSETRSETLLRVSQPRYCDLLAVVTRESVKLQRPIQLPLLAAVRLIGSVRDEHGALVAAATVRVDRRRWETITQSIRGGVPLPDGWRVVGAEQPVTQTENGQFTTEGLQPMSGKYRVVASAPGYNSLVRELDALGDPGSTTTLELVLVARGAVGVVAGTVTFNQKPRQSLVEWKGATRNGSAWTEQDGRFRIPDVECGAVVLRPHLGGAFGANCDPLRPSVEVSVEADEETHADIEVVAPAAAIRGRVLTADGAPAIGAAVDAYARSACWLARDETDAQGEFELEVDVAVGAYLVEAIHDGDQTSREGVAPGTTEVELRLPGIARVRVRAVEARTRERLDALHALFLDDNGARFEFDSGERRSSDPFVGDVDGWHVATLPPGRYQIVVSDAQRGERSGLLPTLVPNVVLARGDDNAPIEVARETGVSVVLQLAPGQASWTEAGYGVVLLEERFWPDVEPTSNGWNVASTAALFDLPRSRAVHLDAAGRAELAGLEPGTLRFKVLPPTMSIEPAEIVLPRPDDQPVLLRWSRL